MSWTHLSDTMPKARKEHRCILCERIIPKGTVHVARRGIGDNGPCTTRMHTACELITRDWDWYEWENQDPFEFRRELSEAGQGEL